MGETLSLKKSNFGTINNIDRKWVEIESIRGKTLRDRTNTTVLFYKLKDIEDRYYVNISLDQKSMSHINIVARDYIKVSFAEDNNKILLIKKSCKEDISGRKLTHRGDVSFSWRVYKPTNDELKYHIVKTEHIDNGVIVYL